MLVTCQVETKEESLEDMCSRTSEDVVQQVSNTGVTMPSSPEDTLEEDMRGRHVKHHAKRHRV